MSIKDSYLPLSKLLFLVCAVGCSKPTPQPENPGTYVKIRTSEDLYNMPAPASDLDRAKLALDNIDKIAALDIGEDEKRRLITIEEEKVLYNASWWGEGRYEKALFLIEQANSVKSLEAWVACIIPVNEGDKRCIDPLKEMLAATSELDTVKRYYLYDRIAEIGGEDQIEYLKSEYSKVKSYDDRSILALHLGDMGDKTGVATLVEIYEKRSDDSGVQNYILNMLERLYGRDVGNDIEKWKEYLARGE